MSKFGIKTLILGTAAYLTAVFYSLDLSLSMLSAANTVLNLMGVLGLATLLVVTVMLVKPFRAVLRNSKDDLSKLLGIAVLGFVILSGAQGCTRIGPGYAGIKVNLSGDDKGVQKAPLVSGWVFYNPLSTDVLEYPTFVQTATWTKDNTPNEETIFNSKEYMAIAADVSLSYSIQRDKIPEFYVKYRANQLETFTHGIMRNVARDAFAEVASKYAVDDLLGAKKEAFLSEVRTRINTQMKPVGIVIDQFGFIGALRPPKNVLDAINAKIAATQKAMQAENELRTAEAEAKKSVAKANGEAESQVARATGSAKSKIALAEGEAKANQLLAQSVTPSLLEWRRLAIQEAAVNKWNGERPKVEGAGSGMLLQIDPSK
jgi:regulator of protease activity HflC (stomatin/prohibitin superfamily)